MSDINISDQKWKFTDKQFCGEVAQAIAGVPDFIENSDRYPKLTKLEERMKQLKKDVCRSNCPSVFTDCKCYKSSDQTPDQTNNVMCATVKEGMVIACPESCCNEGTGCPEPGRITGKENTMPDLPPTTSIIEINDLEEILDETPSILDLIKKFGKNDIVSIVGAGIMVLVVIILFLTFTGLIRA
jgi:hypothetical protein